MRIFGSSILIATLAAVVAFLYGGINATIIVLILGILEISLSFDNAIVNASILEKMSPLWQKVFLTIGIIIAAFGMRLLFPLIIVWISAGINPIAGLKLALHPPTDGSLTYSALVQSVHPQIAAFGGIFLLMLFLKFIMDDHAVFWLTKIEKPLRKLGKLNSIESVIALISLLIIDQYCTVLDQKTSVLIAGICGVVCYTILDSLNSLLSFKSLGSKSSSISTNSKTTDIDNSDISSHNHSPLTSQRTKNACASGFSSFLYLEAIDAAFAFDGVIGAFAITSDPIMILLGLGFIGAIFVRSFTIFLVRKKTLNEFIFLEHGAHWAIGVLSVILLLSIVNIEIPDIITGGVGVILILFAVMTSMLRKKNRKKYLFPHT